MNRIIEALDNMNVKYKIEENSAFIEFWTDTAGQDIPTDFNFDGTADDFVKQFSERADLYDVAKKLNFTLICAGNTECLTRSENF